MLCSDVISSAISVVIALGHQVVGIESNDIVRGCM